MDDAVFILDAFKKTGEHQIIGSVLPSRKDRSYLFVALRATKFVSFIFHVVTSSLQNAIRIYKVILTRFDSDCLLLFSVENSKSAVRQVAVAF